MVEVKEWREPWYPLLSRDILDRAYRAGGEMAWDRADALRVVALVESHGYRVIGVEIWLPTRPGPTIPTPFVYDWRESYEIPAAAFIKTFQWDETDRSHGGTAPYFNISTDP